MVYTNIYPKNHPNVGKYTIHGAYGIQFTGSFYGCFTCPDHVKTSPTDFPDFVTQDFSYTFGEFPHRTVNVYRRVVDMLWDTYIYIYTVYKDIQSIMGYGMRHTTISDGTCENKKNVAVPWQCPKKNWLVVAPDTSIIIWVWVKIRYPNNWMVNSKLD